MKSSKMPAGKFKAQCLRVMDEVNTKQVSVTITKRGKPIAKIVPITNHKKTFFGCLAGTVTICADITKPIDEQWEADS